MNKTNVRRLAMALLTGELAKRKKPVGYNQRTYLSDESCYHDNSGHQCNTVACIAGTAAILHGYRPRGEGKVRSYTARAEKFLGIKGHAARELFDYNPLVDQDPNARQAALVLFHLAETGKVDWDVARNA